MKTLAILLTLIAFPCTEGIEPTESSGGAATIGTGEGDCEPVCHDYGGGIEECTCIDGEGRAALDLGPPRQVPDPYVVR